MVFISYMVQASMVCTYCACMRFVPHVASAAYIRQFYPSIYPSRRSKAPRFLHVEVFNACSRVKPGLPLPYFLTRRFVYGSSSAHFVVTSCAYLLQILGQGVGWCAGDARPGSTSVGGKSKPTSDLAPGGVTVPYVCLIKLMESELRVCMLVPCMCDTSTLPAGARLCGCTAAWVRGGSAAARVAVSCPVPL